MTRCPACLRIVLVTPHLTDDRRCDGVTFAGAVDGFVPVPNDHAVAFDDAGVPMIVPAPIVTEYPGRGIELDPEVLALVAAGAV